MNDCVQLYLKDEQGQEIQVGSSLKLLVQVQGEEGKNVVLVCLDGISLQVRNKKENEEKVKSISLYLSGRKGQVSHPIFIQLLVQ